MFAPDRLFEKLHRRPWYGGTLRAWAAGLNLPAGAEVLEIGCGPGLLCADLAEMGLKPTGLDASESMLRRARKLNPGGDFISGRLPGAELNGRSFDAILCASVLNVVPDPTEFLTSAIAHLRPGGAFAALFPTLDLDPNSFALETGFDRAAARLWAEQSPKLETKPALKAALNAGLRGVEAVKTLQGLGLLRGLKG